MLVLVDETYSQSHSPRTERLRTATDALQGAVTVVDALPLAHVSVDAAARPPQDEEVSVWIDGDWPDGTRGERAVAHGLVGNGAFAFSSSIGLNLRHQTLFQLCCDSDSCAQVCTECNDIYFACCVSGRFCCWALCGFDQCPCR